jgi:glycerol kinase
MAGIAAGYWSGLDDVRGNWRMRREFRPTMNGDARAKLVAGWQKAVAAAKGFK